jgi:hypothetical protein
MFSKSRPFERKLFFLLIAFEAVLFYTFYARELARYPPLDFDQTTYLTIAYDLQERIHANGLSEVWKELWNSGHPNSLLLPIEGTLVALVLGGVRWPQLGVLFIAFCALQGVAFATARTVWKDRVYGYTVLGLILAQGSMWFWAGGLFDFRMDFFAYCFYGIWTCAVLRSNIFLDRGWSIGAGFTAAFLVLNRFLTIIYVVGVSVGLGAICLCLWLLLREDPDLVRRLKCRLLNLGLSLSLLLFITTPILLNNWAAIYGKYVVAQFYYEKDIRAREFGITGLSGHLLYYPFSIFRDHLGPTFFWASAIGVAGALAARLLGRLRKSRAAQPSGGDETSFLRIIFLLGAVLGPIIVLTIDISKSPVIGGVVGVPAALLAGAIMAGIAARPTKPQSFPDRKMIVACSVVILVIGLFNQIGHAVRHLPEYAQRRDLERVAELDKWLVDYADENHWRRPTISFDVISSWLDAGTITTRGYESSRRLIEFQTTSLGSKIMGVERTEALAALAKSDFVVLTDLPKTGFYPFYEHISKYWGELKEWADLHLIVARTVRLDSFTATVYARPSVTVSGLSGEWITRSGLSIQTRRASLERFPEVRLSGTANYSWLPKVPNISATVDALDKEISVPTYPRSIRDFDRHHRVHSTAIRFDSISS